MASQQSPSSSSSKKPKFSVYQNPKFSAALTARSLQPSSSALLFSSAATAIAGFSLHLLSSREKQLVYNLTQIHVPLSTAFLISKCLQGLITLLLVLSLSALIRALSLRKTKKALAIAASIAKKPEEKDNLLTQRQLGLLGLNPKATENAEAEQSKKPPKSKPITPQRTSETLVPIRKPGFGSTPSRQSRIGLDHQSSNSAKKTPISPVSASPTRASPWSRQSSGSAKGILTEEMLEQYLADVDEKFTESATNSVTTTPQSTVRGFGIASPGSVGSSATASGTARSTPLRPVRMSPGSHQKYTTPPKKGEGDLPSPMSMEQAVEAFENLGVYPQIRQWEDRIRQWFSSVLMNPLLDKIETSHIQVMQAASAIGISITVTQVGSDPVSTAAPVNVSPINGAKEWQPAVTVDEDGLLHQLRATLVQTRDGSMSQLLLAGQQQIQQNPLLPLVQQCVDAITEHQRLNTLMKGELVKGLLPHSSVRADYTVQRVRELAEGTCLKNFDYMGDGDSYNKAGKKASSELPSDSHLLLYLFCAFLEHPKWMLHVDPSSYSGSRSSKNPLFLGVLPPKDRFPEKYVAIISGVPSVIHPGACVLSVGKQSPPIFALYWDKKLQFSLQGRTALWDALLLLCHKIKVGYGGIVRGVHLGSSAFNLLPVLDSNDES
ncbi:uncharacterized protein LOC109842745 isoform X1 [Asparagus officinalis]|uniref:uncharacterized protein LOC109842745 isoform X1 n=1 Tax=Asparagus officinalis TaxID=4686 RepID=UPI00098E34E2|nr:uncharacterized protein LOC109842745 isoform X1 [Asparagus officinalis]